MPQQIITIRPDGSLFGLQHKRGKGVDLRKLGPASIRRETIIEWDEEHQAWFIGWTEETGRDASMWDTEEFEEAGVSWTRFGGWVCHGYLAGSWISEVILFKDYEDAVEAEIAVVQSLQKRGELVD
jgi:hypothetical protein